MRNPAYTIFNYALFDSPEFRAFAVEVAKVVEMAAETVWLQLEELHLQLAQSLQGYIHVNVMMMQWLHLQQVMHFRLLDQRFATLTDTVSSDIQVKPSKRRHTSRKATPSATPLVTNQSVATPVIQQALWQPTPFSIPELPLAGSLSMTSPVGLVLPESSQGPSKEQTPLSNAGCSALYFVRESSVTISILCTQFSDWQERSMKDIEGQIGFGKVENHSWDWVEYPSREDEWIPRQDLCLNIMKDIATLSCSKAWQEYEKGLDGLVSICELESVWKTRGRASKPDVATELTRRQHLWRLVGKLEELEGWDTTMVMDSLQEKYPIGPAQQKELRTAGNFVRWLQKDKNVAARILEEAAAYLEGNGLTEDVDGGGCAKRAEGVHMVDVCQMDSAQNGLRTKMEGGCLGTLAWIIQMPTFHFCPHTILSAVHLTHINRVNSFRALNPTTTINAAQWAYEYPLKIAAGQRCTHFKQFIDLANVTDFIDDSLQSGSHLVLSPRFPQSNEPDLNMWMRTLGDGQLPKSSAKGEDPVPFPDPKEGDTQAQLIHILRRIDPQLLHPPDTQLSIPSGASERYAHFLRPTQILSPKHLQPYLFTEEALKKRKLGKDESSSHSSSSTNPTLNAEGLSDDLASASKKKKMLVEVSASSASFGTFSVKKRPPNMKKIWSKWASGHPIAPDLSVSRQEFASGKWVKVRGGPYKNDAGIVWRPDTTKTGAKGYFILLVPWLSYPENPGSQDDAVKAAILKEPIPTSPLLDHSPPCLFCSKDFGKAVEQESDHTFCYKQKTFTYGLLIKFFRELLLTATQTLPPDLGALFLHSEHSFLQNFPLPLPEFFVFLAGDKVSLLEDGWSGVIKEVSGETCVANFGDDEKHAHTVEHLQKVVVPRDLIHVVAGEHTGKEGLVVERHASCHEVPLFPLSFPFLAPIPLLAPVCHFDTHLLL
ncbi:hypothetical protein PQX77_018904 [Marasmius sp. AFHP31]|nr:hypothetical protein PQX77_018904 [Marasmius sp. AFHP31]